MNILAYSIKCFFDDIIFDDTNSVIIKSTENSDMNAASFNFIVNHPLGLYLLNSRMEYNFLSIYLDCGALGECFIRFKEDETNFFLIKRIFSIQNYLKAKFAEQSTILLYPNHIEIKENNP